MKRLVSQNTRLIPSPRADAAHTHQRVRRPRFFSPIRAMQEEDRFARSAFSEHTPRCTNQVAHDIWTEYLLSPVQSSSLPAPGGRNPRDERVFVWLSRSRRACDSAQGWADDLPRSAE